jgi:hypothetical protein
MGELLLNTTTRVAMGQPVGFYSDGTNIDGMLASPASSVPEPRSIALALAGAPGMVCVWGKKLRRGTIN